MTESHLSVNEKNAVRVKFDFGIRTDVGRERKENQDFAAIQSAHDLHLLLVCDGVGGQHGGGAASQVASVAVLERFQQSASLFRDMREFIIDAVTHANQRLIEIAQAQDPNAVMATTIVLALLRQNHGYVAHVGDSRAYLVRNGQTRRLTKDHSLVQRLIDAGEIEAEEASQHPERNVITKALGREGNIEVEIPDEPLELAQGDVLMVCSDGLHGKVSDEEICVELSKYEPQAACDRLVELANSRGGDDNISLVVAKVANISSK